MKLAVTVKMTWPDVAARLKLDERQTAVGEYLLNRGKDACLMVWASEAEGGEPAPIAYAAELAARGEHPGDPSTGTLLREYLTTKKKRGATSTYLQLLYESERATVKEIMPLLDEAQQAAFLKLEIGSLVLDIDTGYSPIDHRIGVLTSKLRHGTPVPEESGGARGYGLLPEESTAGRRDWLLSSDPLLRVNGVTEHPGVGFQQVCARLSLNARQEAVVRYTVDALHTESAVLWSTVSENYGFSPLEFIVDMRRRGGSDVAAIERPLVEFLRTRRPVGADVSYLESQTRLEQSVYDGLGQIIGFDLSAPLHDMGVSSFLSIDTGHAPIAFKLRELAEEDQLKRGIDLFCAMPFEYAHIEDNGDVLPCCPSKFRLSIGNLRTSTMHEVWNSRAAEAVRESIHDKTFRFCDYHACEYLKEGRNKHAAK